METENISERKLVPGVYIPLYYKEESETKVWGRSLEDFMGTKEIEGGTVVNRFEFISER
jgi:hypothetical protein